MPREGEDRNGDRQQRTGKRMEIKRRRREKQMSCSSGIRGKFSKLSSIPEGFALDPLILSLIPYKSPRKYIKRVPGKERAAVAWPAKRLRPLTPSRVVRRAPPGRGEAQAQRGTTRTSEGQHWKGRLPGRAQETPAEGWRGWGRPDGRQPHLSLSRLRQGQRNLNLLARMSCSVYNMRGPQLKSVSQLHGVPSGPPQPKPKRLVD